MKKLQISAIVISLNLILTSCSFVSVDNQANDVIVSPNAKALSRCKFLGNANVSLWSKAGWVQTKEKLELELDNLARNEAIKLGGNAVTPVSEIQNGKRTYGVYTCAGN